MTCEPVLPAVRAAVFTAVCLGLGVAAHRAMSQVGIPVWALVLGALGVFAVARLGACRERGRVGIAVVMGGLQVALHLLFGYAQDLGAPSAAPASMAGMPMPAGGSMPMSGMSAPVHAMPMPGDGSGMHMGLGMVLGHALAAVVCAWWLHRGEAAVHELARGAAGWIAARLAVPVLVASGPVVRLRPCGLRIGPVALALHAQWFRVGRVLRGPPVSPSFT